MKNVISTLLIFLNIAVFGQITGVIADQQGEALPGASVAAYNATGELVTGTTTEPNGSFSLQVPSGTYNLEVTFIAYDTYRTEVTVKEGETLKLGKVQLSESSTALEEVTVEGKANLMQFQQDKRVFNVSQDLTNIGSNASEILNNVPSVSVDIEGNVSLRGSQNVRILVNGKPSGLIGSDPASALRQLQGSMIEKIEVITNPSARYDAEGEAGIINIVLAKKQAPGFNGTFEGRAGYPKNLGTSAGVNYRAGSFNWFANGSFNTDRSPGGGFNNQLIFVKDTLPDGSVVNDTSYSYQTRDQSRGEYGGQIRVGADYLITPNQTLTGTFLYSGEEGLNYATLTYRDYNTDSMLVQEIIRQDDELEKEQTLEGDLHWEKLFEMEDHKWTADFNYRNEDDLESSSIFQDTGRTPTSAFQRVSNQEDEQNILIQTDYVHPFSEVKRFEVGARATFRDLINNYSVEEQVDGEWRYLPAFTNDFRYFENIYALYGIYSDGFLEKFTYQFGLRTEYSDIATESGDVASRIDKEYINFFPSVFFTWDINELSDLQVNYSRRISRPHFRSLLPFSNFSDPRNFWRGNPDLNPEYTDSYEAGYIRYWDKATLYSGIYYRHRTGVTERIRVVDSISESGIQYSSIFPVNLSVQDAYGFEFNLSLDITEWYSFNANLNLYRAITTGEYGGQDLGNVNTTSTGRFMNRISFWDSDAQVSFNYRGPSTSPQGRQLGIYTLDIGWSKDILKGNGTIGLSVRDLFNSRKRRGYTYLGNAEIYSEFQWRQRQFMLNFTYRINQKKGRGGEGGRSDQFGDDGGY